MPANAEFYADAAVHHRVRILENVCVAKDTYRIRFECPELASRIVPGQFLMLRLANLDDPLLGRPLALYDIQRDANHCPLSVDVVYLVGGKMTRRLAEFQAGQVLEVWGPLGNGFSVGEEFSTLSNSHLIMVAGGIGQTPFLALAKQHLGLETYGDRSHENKVGQVSFCYGARSADYFAGVDDFRRAGVEVHLSTDDGSEGHHGFVTDLLSRLIDSSESQSVQIVCCGPEPMMEAVSEIAIENRLPCQVSLETPMACGIGICFSCVAKIKDDTGDWDYCRTCVEGPVFEASKIVW